MNTFFPRFIFSSVYDMVPFVFFVAMTIVAAYLYHRRSASADLLRTAFIRFFAIVAGFRILFAFVKTIFQYYAWAQDSMGKLLLPPSQSIFVFIRYAWTHFWINVFISIAVGLFMFVLLYALQRKNARFFEDGEVELGALLAMLVGWPHFVVFFPLTFLFVVCFSIIRGVAFKEPFTTLGWPLLVAAFVALAFSMPLLSFLHLTALII